MAHFLRRIYTLDNIASILKIFDISAASGTDINYSATGNNIFKEPVATLRHIHIHGITKILSCITAIVIYGFIGRFHIFHISDPPQR